MHNMMYRHGVVGVVECFGVCAWFSSQDEQLRKKIASLHGINLV